MTNNTTKPDSFQPAAEMAVDLFDDWFDPIETEVRARSRQFVPDAHGAQSQTALLDQPYALKICT
jgi:putative transposase